MPEEETHLAQDVAAEDTGEIRKKAMTRLVVAGVVTAAALGALWLLDRDGAPEKKKPAKTPAPIVAAPAPIVEPAAPAPETPAAESKPEPPPPTAPEAAHAGKPAEAAPAGKKSGAAPAASTPPATTAPTKGASGGTPPASPAPARAEAAKPATTAPATPSPRPEGAATYVVQLGVFADPANAKDLVERLAKLGVQARMETRVQVGPFDKREDADKARAAMLKLGVKGVVATK
jgi:DedD protein